MLMMGLTACGNEQDKHAASDVTAESVGVHDVEAAKKTPEVHVKASGVSTQDVKKDDSKPVAIQKQTEEASQAVVSALLSDDEKNVPDPTIKETPVVEPIKHDATDNVAKVSGDIKQPVVALGDAVKGKTLAKRCNSCHDFGMKDKFGPHLQGVYNRAAGKSGFRKHGAALKSANWVWDDSHLLKWLCDSKAAIKEFTGDPSAKTNMPKQGMCGVKGEDIVAYLKTL